MNSKKKKMYSKTKYEIKSILEDWFEKMSLKGDKLVGILSIFFDKRFKTRDFSS